MRFLTTSLLNAFPQLDPFPIEKRRRFFKRALPRWLHAGSEVAVLFSSLGAGFAMISWSPFPLSSSAAHMKASYGIYLDPLALLVITTFVAAIFTGGILLFVRDLLIKLRLREILGSRGLCQACSHSLLGLPVPDDFYVTCPECGERSEVDPSFCELTTPEESRLQSTRTTPSEHHTPSPVASTRVVTHASQALVPLHKSKSARVLLIILASLITLILTAAMIIIIYEEFVLRAAARFAKSKLLSPQTLTDGTRGKFVAASPQSVAAWNSLINHLQKPHTRFPPPNFNLLPVTVGGWPATPSDTPTSLSSALQPHPSLFVGYWIQNLRAESGVMERASLDLYADQQWHRDLMQLLKDLQPHARSLAQDDGHFLATLGFRRNLLTFSARQSLAAAIMASRKGDLESFEIFSRSSLDLLRLLRDQPIVSGFNADAEPGEFVTLRVLLALAQMHSDPAWLKAIESQLALLPNTAEYVDHRMSWSESLIDYSGLAYVADMSNLRWQHGPVTRHVFDQNPMLASLELKPETLRQATEGWITWTHGFTKLLKVPIALRTTTSTAKRGATLDSMIDEYTQTLILAHISLAHKRHFKASGFITDDLTVLSQFSTNPALISSAKDWGLTLTFEPTGTIQELPPESELFVPTSSPLPADALTKPLQRQPATQGSLFIKHHGGSIQLTPPGPIRHSPAP